MIKACEVKSDCPQQPQSGERGIVRRSTPRPIVPASLVSRQNNGALLTTAVLCRIVDRRSLAFTLRRAEHQYSAFDFLRQSLELRLAVDIGGGFEIKPPHARESVSDVDSNAGVVNRRAFGIGKGEGNRTRPGFSIHHWNLVRIWSLLAAGRHENACENYQCSRKQDAFAKLDSTGHLWLLN
jgi:hypothetical protein